MVWKVSITMHRGAGSSALEVVFHSSSDIECFRPILRIAITGRMVIFTEASA